MSYFTHKFVISSTKKSRRCFRFSGRLIGKPALGKLIKTKNWDLGKEKKRKGKVELNQSSSMYLGNKMFVTVFGKLKVSPTARRMRKKFSVNYFFNSAEFSYFSY